MKLRYFIILFTFISCLGHKNANDGVASILPSAVLDLQSQSKVTLILPKGDKLYTYMALTVEEQTQGLSGLKDHQFSDNEAMIFMYPKNRYHSFWMPDTYFNLDIFFLDKELKIVDVERNVLHHPGRSTPPPIPTTRAIYAQHVLEVKSKSSLAKSLNIGDRLQWVAPPEYDFVLKNLKDF